MKKLASRLSAFPLRELALTNYSTRDLDLSTAELPHLESFELYDGTCKRDCFKGLEKSPLKRVSVSIKHYPHGLIRAIRNAPLEELDLKHIVDKELRMLNGKCFKRFNIHNIITTKPHDKKEPLCISAKYPRLYGMKVSPLEFVEILSSY